jgi:hypothetical protein
MHVQLVVQVYDMRLNGASADEEFRGDFGSGQASAEQYRDFSFASRHLRKAFPYLLFTVEEADCSSFLKQEYKLLRWGFRTASVAQCISEYIATRGER